MFRFGIVAAALTLLAACSPAPDDGDTGEATPGEDTAAEVASTWVSRAYSGGRQCAPREDFAPPDTRAELEEAGVTVLETTERTQAVCMACDCPAYAATHYARIAADDADTATEAGFEPSDGPPSGDQDTSPSTGGAVAFEGLGQEPGWMLDIVPGEHIHFAYDYAQREVFMPVPEPETGDGRTTYHAVTEEHDLRVVIEDTPCTDVMSGQAFEATVTVTLDGEVYRGCGERA